jgi:hypothetical protein
MLRVFATACVAMVLMLKVKASPAVLTITVFISGTEVLACLSETQTDRHQVCHAADGWP